MGPLNHIPDNVSNVNRKALTVTFSILSYNGCGNLFLWLQFPGRFKVFITLDYMPGETFGKVTERSNCKRHIWD